MNFPVLTFLCLSFVAAVPLWYRPDDTVPTPSKDPFYAPPPSWHQAAPGDILRVREAPGNLTDTFSGASKVYNILYRSTDTNYMPTYGFTTLFAPLLPADGKVNQILTYLVAYDTPDVDAGPTSLLYGSAASLSLVYTDIQASLSKGWYVNVPDYEGPRASFICEVQAAHSTLDSIRAVLGHFARANFLPSPNSSRVAIWGYSGGSIAGEMTLELQVQYAPELTSTLVGAALGGLAPNITDVLHNALGTMNWIIPSVLVGFATQHPDVEAYLLSQLKLAGPIYNASNFLAVEHMSAADAGPYYANQTMANYFKSGLDFFQAPVLQTAFSRDASEGVHGLPQVPMFIYKAIHDEGPSVASADKLVDRLCEYSGTNILYERNSIGGHIAEAINVDTRALAWLAGVLDATYSHWGCTIHNVTVGEDKSPV